MEVGALTGSRSDLFGGCESVSTRVARNEEHDTVIERFGREPKERSRMKRMIGSDFYITSKFEELRSEGQRVGLLFHW